MKPRIIGLTQRVDVLVSYGERRDALDQRWTDLIEKCGFLALPLPNIATEPLAYLDALRVDGIVLTGGNDIAEAPGGKSTATERDVFERSCIAWCAERETPLLAVCRGMQALNVFFGGSVVSCGGHVRTRHKILPTAAWPFPLAREFDVNSFHDYGVVTSGLGEGLEVIGFTPDGWVESVRHRTHPFVGIMWHPEREKPYSDRDIAIFQQVFGVGRP